MQTQLTLLNGMAGSDIERSIEQHREWGLRWTDLKDALWGKSILDLEAAQAERLADLLEKADLRVWCFSTGLFGRALSGGYETFKDIE